MYLNQKICDDAKICLYSRKFVLIQGIPIQFSQINAIFELWQGKLLHHKKKTKLIAFILRLNAWN